MEVAVILIMWALAIALSAAIGHKKGRLTFGVVLGVLLGFIGCIIIALVKKNDDEDHYNCPACGERILVIARICKHCKTELRKVL
jgi:hypothetical protein